jgi:hypothetical protein
MFIELKGKQKAIQTWWYTSVITTLRRLRQKDPESNASLGFIGRPCLKTKITTTKEIKK